MKTIKVRLLFRLLSPCQTWNNLSTFHHTHGWSPGRSSQPNLGLVLSSHLEQKETLSAFSSAENPILMP